MSIDELLKILEHKEQNEAYKWFVPNLLPKNNQLDVFIGIQLHTLAFCFGGNRAGKTMVGGINILGGAMGWWPDFLVWFEDTMRKHIMLPKMIKIPEMFLRKGNPTHLPMTDAVREFHSACWETDARFFVGKENRHAGKKLCWIISKDARQQKGAAQKILSKYLPDDEINRSKNEKDMYTTRGIWMSIKLKNGSELEFKTYEQGRGHFQGAPVDHFWSDEECPEDVWDEVLARIIDTNGNGWVTMTPLSGLTFMYERYYEPWKQGEGSYPVFQLSSYENPTNTTAKLKEISSGWDEQTKKARLEGEFVSRSGLLYEDFDREKHLYNFEPPDCVWFMGLDFGADHPTACVWVGMDKDRHWWVHQTYSEIGSFRQHATAIHAVKYTEKARGKYIDPSAKQAQIEFGSFGIHFNKGVNDREAGISIIRGLLQEGKLHIHESNVELVYEFEHHRLRPTSRIGEHADVAVVKKDDDLLDALRYALASRPEASGGEKIRLRKRFDPFTERRRGIHPITKRPMRQ